MCTTRPLPVATLFPYTTLFRSEKRLESIGSRVKATKSDITTAATIVSPNWRKNCPTMPDMKATGTNTAVTVNVVARTARSEEHTSELQSLRHLVCRLLLEKKKT